MSRNNPEYTDYVGWQTTASAMEIALERVDKEQLLNGIDLQFDFFNIIIITTRNILLKYS